LPEATYQSCYKGTLNVSVFTCFSFRNEYCIEILSLSKE
jgi:hypothetical protein